MIIVVGMVVVGLLIVGVAGCAVRRHRERVKWARIHREQVRRLK